MNEKSGNFELLEPIKPEALVPDSPVEPWMIAVGVILILAVLAIVIFKKKRVAPIDVRKVREEAHAEAVAGLNAIGAIPAREAAVQSSLILRRYLSVAAGDPALFETHEEYLSRHESLKDFSEEARGFAEAGFSRLARLKYAPVVAETDPGGVLEMSRNLLETLHHGFKA